MPIEEKLAWPMPPLGQKRAYVTARRLSEDIEATNRVEIIADVTVAGRADARLEKIVTKLGGEPGVFAVSWKSVPTSEEERALVPEG
jgi:uncharacterized membrane protein YhiD involved in acid resistance